MDKITVLENLKACAQAAKSFANGLVSDLAIAVTEALIEMDENKAEKTNGVSLSIPATGWVNGSGTYPKYYDISVSGVTAKDRVTINISPGSLNTAISCGMCPTNETLANKIRVRAISVPTAPISVEYWIEKGKE